VGSCEHGNEPSGSIKDGKLLDELNDYQFLKHFSAPVTTVLLFGFVDLLKRSRSLFIFNILLTFKQW
jgi:hypothetical protein